MNPQKQLPETLSSRPLQNGKVADEIPAHLLLREPLSLAELLQNGTVQRRRRVLQLPSLPRKHSTGEGRRHPPPTQLCQDPGFSAKRGQKEAFLGTGHCFSSQAVTQRGGSASGEPCR